MLEILLIYHTCYSKTRTQPTSSPDQNYPLDHAASLTSKSGTPIVLRRIVGKSLYKEKLLSTHAQLLMHWSVVYGVSMPHSALAALPTCIISPVLCSSLLKTGHEVPSAFTKFTSNLVPIILNDEAAVSIAAYRGTTALYRLGGASVVGRSRVSSVWAKSTEAFSLSIFFRKNEAMTDFGVW